jgi:hypothetical protein
MKEEMAHDTVEEMAHATVEEMVHGAGLHGLRARMKTDQTEEDKEEFLFLRCYAVEGFSACASGKRLVVLAA